MVQASAQQFRWLLGRPLCSSAYLITRRHSHSFRLPSDAAAHVIITPNTAFDLHFGRSPSPGTPIVLGPIAFGVDFRARESFFFILPIHFIIESRASSSFWSAGGSCVVAVTSSGGDYAAACDIRAQCFFVCAFERSVIFAPRSFRGAVLM